MQRLVLPVLVLSILFAACGDDKASPTAPSPTTPTSPTSPNPTTPAPPADPGPWTVSGRVTDAASGSPIAAATVRILDGEHANKMATTDQQGRYSLADVRGNMNVSVTAEGYKELRTGFNVMADMTRDFRLEEVPASDCYEVLGVSYRAHTNRFLSDWIVVRFVIRNNCERRIRFHGRLTSSFVVVEVYDNLSQSGSPLGDGLLDPFEVAGNTTATIEDDFPLDRGTIRDIPGSGAIVMKANISYVD